MTKIRDAWLIAAQLLAEHRDLLDARIWDGVDEPEALGRRGWAEALLRLDANELCAHEVSGLDADWSLDAPRSLVDLARAAREVCALPMLSKTEPSMGALRRKETPRKRMQVEAFAELVRPLARSSERVIDVGSGHGHLTREIAEGLLRPVVGLERDADLTSRARTLSPHDDVSFRETDVLRDGLALTHHDCVIGLHACGELGDAIVETAAKQARSVALVGCCLQKRRKASRSSLNLEAFAPALDARALDLPRSLLGLSNLTARAVGVERTREENLEARRRRLALFRLLERRGIALVPGAELNGLNRRSAHKDFAWIALRAFAARDLGAPSSAELAEAWEWATIHHERARRLSLPRALLARSIEVFVLLDRALHLEEHGFGVRIGTVFPAEVSARNLVLLASRDTTFP